MHRFAFIWTSTLLVVFPQKVLTVCFSDQFWCEEQGICLPDDQPCCDALETRCQCGQPRQFCQSTKLCLPQGEVCCDWGETWCDSTGTCSPAWMCCQQGYKWCQERRDCIPNQEHCCTTDQKWCQESESCVPIKEDCQCRDDHYLCNNTNVCIHKKQVCESCKMGYIMCTYPSHFDTQHLCYTKDIFNRNQNLKVCPNGICRDTRYWNCDESFEGCKNETFKCGDECKPNHEFLYYRTCQGRCTARDEICTKKDETTFGVITIILATSGSFVLAVLSTVLVVGAVKRKKIWDAMYPARESVESNPEYGEEEEDGYVETEIVDYNDYYGNDEV